MISTGAFQTEMDASNKQPTLAEKFVAVWEKKNTKVTMKIFGNNYEKNKFKLLGNYNTNLICFFF